MKTTFIGIASAGIAVLALTACASSGTATTAASGSSNAKPAAVNTTAKMVDGYQLVKKNGTEYYCRTDRAPGSHVRTIQTCLTKEQLDAQQRGTDTFVRGITSPVTPDQQTDGNGGRTNTVMGQ